jgi:hypothetical protein
MAVDSSWVTVLVWESPVLSLTSEPLIPCAKRIVRSNPGPTLRGSVATGNAHSGAALGKIAEKQAAPQESEYSDCGS